MVRAYGDLSDTYVEFSAVAPPYFGGDADEVSGGNMQPPGGSAAPVANYMCTDCSCISPDDTCSHDNNTKHKRQTNSGRFEARKAFTKFTLDRGAHARPM